MSVPDEIKKLTEKLYVLIPPDMRHVPGQKDGLLLRASPRGVYLSFVDTFGIPKNFTAQHRKWMNETLAPKFPNLDLEPMLARSSETGRRYNSLNQRLENAKKDMKSGKVIALESLDYSGAKKRPISESTKLSTKAPGAIPRAYTFVRLDPPPATRVLVFSDLPMKDSSTNKTIIPDEITVSYPMSDDELKATKKSHASATFTSFTDIAHQFKNTSHLKITCGDINKELVGEQLIEHYQKTLRGLTTVTEKLLKDFGINPDKVTATATDSFLHSAEAVFKSSTDVSMRRRTANGTKTSMLVEFLKDAVTGEFKLTKLEPQFSGSALKLALRLEWMIVPVVANLEDALKKLAGAKKI